MKTKNSFNSKYVGLSVQHGDIQYIFDSLSYLEKRMVEIVGVNQTMLTLISSLITSLSVNFLTSFINIDTALSPLRTATSICRLLFCLVFNVYFVRFTIAVLKLNERIIIKTDLIPKKREIDKSQQILYLACSNIDYLKKCVIISAIFGLLMIVCVIVYPFLP